MTRITISSELLAQLRAAPHTVDLCDEYGNVVGQFTPQLDPEEWESLEPQISEEEIRERMKEEGGRTLAEILADLEKRA
jgi:CRISPR/Cas system-associated endonuclease Cas1